MKLRKFARSSFSCKSLNRWFQLRKHPREELLTSASIGNPIRPCDVHEIMLKMDVFM